MLARGSAAVCRSGAMTADRGAEDLAFCAVGCPEQPATNKTATIANGLNMPTNAPLLPLWETIA